MKATFAFCLERPCFCAALGSLSFPGSSVLGAQQSPAPAPPCLPLHRSICPEPDQSAQHPRARDVCPGGQHVLRPPRRTERSALSTRVPLTCALASRARGGGTAGQRSDKTGWRTRRLSPYGRPASVRRAGSFIISLGPNPCAGAWPAVLTSDARRG